MSMMKLFVSTLLGATSTAAMAQMQPAANSPPIATAAAETKGKRATDPDKIVCRTMEITGSRLNKKRVCHTAEEWAEQRALDRTQIERQQANRYNGNGNQ